MEVKIKIENNFVIISYPQTLNMHLKNVVPSESESGVYIETEEPPIELLQTQELQLSLSDAHDLALKLLELIKSSKISLNKR